MDYPIEWVKLAKYVEITGDSADSVHARRKAGKWLDGNECKIVDGDLWVSLLSVERWVEAWKPMRIDARREREGSVSGEQRQAKQMRNEELPIPGALPATGHLRQSDLIGSRDKSTPRIIPFSHATLWRKVKAKEFPAPVKLSANVTAWRVEDIRAWMESRG